VWFAFAVVLLGVAGAFAYGSVWFARASDYPATVRWSQTIVCALVAVANLVGAGLALRMAAGGSSHL
jgi:hypothetical protein